jgi:hypothetical protein
MLLSLFSQEIWNLKPWSILHGTKTLDAELCDRQMQLFALVHPEQLNMNISRTVVWSTVVCKFPAALNIWILALRTKIWLPSVHLLRQCWDSMNRMLAACFIEGDHGDGCMNLCMHVSCILSWIYSISADCKSESISATILFFFCACISEVFLHKGQYCRGLALCLLHLVRYCDTILLRCAFAPDCIFNWNDNQALCLLTFCSCSLLLFFILQLLNSWSCTMIPNVHYCCSLLLWYLIFFVFSAPACYLLLNMLPL